jgi:Tfp pilus assembly protein PilV
MPSSGRKGRRKLRISLDRHNSELDIWDMWRTNVHRNPPARARRGFTLMETALVTIIVGTGVVAVMQLLAAGSMASRQGQDMTTAIQLANQIHEMSLSMTFSDPVTPTQWGPSAGETLATYNDVTDLDGQTFSPPIDARRQTLADLANWSQSVVVNSVDPNRITTIVPKGSSRGQQITVTVSHLGQAVWSESWFVFDGNP